MRLRKDREMPIGSTGEVKEGKRIKRFVCWGACAVHPRQRKTFASAIKRLWPGKGSAAWLGIQEHENRVQLSPGKGYLIGNESEICTDINDCFAKGKQIDDSFLWMDKQI